MFNKVKYLRIAIDEFHNLMASKLSIALESTRRYHGDRDTKALLKQTTLIKLGQPCSGNHTFGLSFAIINPTKSIIHRQTAINRTKHIIFSAIIYIPLR